MEPTVPASWCQAIADELHRIAYDLGNVVNAKGDLPEPNYVHLHIQPTGNEDEQIAAIDDLGIALTGKPGDPDKMSDGTYHYRADAGRGPVMVRLYTSIETARAERMLAEREAADKDAEIKRLRALVAELEAGKPADPTGLAYSRADDEPEGDVTQQLGHRIEPHVGAVTEQGLVDETPSDEALTGAAITEACVITGWGGVCTTHEARHIASGEDGECGCPVYPFAGRGDSADTIVDHREGCGATS